MGIFGPIWMTRSERKTDKAVAFVRSITDQDLLKTIVFEAPLRRVKEAAMQAINDDSILMEIATTVELGNFVQDYAVAQIKDQQVLADLLMEKGAFDGPKEAAVSRITDQHILADLAMKDLGRRTTAIRPRNGLYDFRWRAFHKITDQNELLRVAKGAADESIARDAGNKITDEALRELLPKPKEEKRIPEEWEFLRFQCSQCHRELVYEDGYNDVPYFRCDCKETNKSNWETVRVDTSIIRSTYVLLCPVCYKLRESAGPSCHIGYCTCGDSVRHSSNSVPMHVKQTGW